MGNRKLRQRFVATAGAALLLMVIPLASSSAMASSPAVCHARGSVHSCVYAYSGHEVTFVVPSGVTSIFVHAIGAAGGNSYQCVNNPCPGDTLGARGAGVRARVSVRPGEKLYIDVGGTPAIGSTNGGTAGTSGATVTGGTGGGAGYNGQGGGGGGASVVLTCSLASSNCAQGFYTAADPRLIVAAGGGGAGFSGGFGGVGGPDASGTHSCAGACAGSPGSGCGVYKGSGNGGALGGGAGTGTGPGAGGAGSDGYGGITASGSNGAGMTGGNGWDPTYNAAYGEAGGGGGGYYGGGGGGSDTEYDNCGAGGGAGSSFVNSKSGSHGTYNTAQTRTPRILIRYT